MRPKGNKDDWIARREAASEKMNGHILEILPQEVRSLPIFEDREGLINLLRGVNSESEPSRSIYLPIVRDQVPEVLSLFDFPDASLVTGERDTTNVPSQSLYLMNSTEVRRLADSFAQRLASYEADEQGKLVYAFMLAFGRQPRPEEVLASKQFLNQFIAKEMSTRGSTQVRAEAQKVALAAFCQSLIASAEFRYLR